MKAKIVKVALSLLVAGVCASVAMPSQAQDTGLTATNATQAAPTTKAQRKAARKQARAKKNAELKKLEDAGYNPSRANDPSYPEDLQKAQKKAGVGVGASQ
ncbi:hypothetical protein P9250_30895 [Caballeronia sp. LP006]|uniref:DUF4148 domain-containing protein n=1 Tax=Caballeronia sp. LP006 TaxID=3038552 RepID=UPI0028656C44|nr:DUF4148 domain-containing protein [Caballeronia sp. LP006]MDR5832273.1 hypothetical protein [Caballeronia sp. LP006]